MTALRRVFASKVGPDRVGAAVVQPVLTGVWVFTFLAGALYLPTLGPTRLEFIFGLLLLAGMALGCTAVGQLATIQERLERKGD